MLLCPVTRISLGVSCVTWRGDVPALYKQTTDNWWRSFGTYKFKIMVVLSAITVSEYNNKHGRADNFNCHHVQHYKIRTNYYFFQHLHLLISIDWQLQVEFQEMQNLTGLRNEPNADYVASDSWYLSTRICNILHVIYIVNLTGMRKFGSLYMFPGHSILIYVGVF